MYQSGILQPTFVPPITTISSHGFTYSIYINVQTSMLYKVYHVFFEVALFVQSHKIRKASACVSPVITGWSWPSRFLHFFIYQWVDQFLLTLLSQLCVVALERVITMFILHSCNGLWLLFPVWMGILHSAASHVSWRWYDPDWPVLRPGVMSHLAHAEMCLLTWLFGH